MLHCLEDESIPQFLMKYRKFNGGRLSREELGFVAKNNTEMGSHGKILIYFENLVIRC